jgi:tetratricopeptide (TPR) repeat protein/CHAT domain-containing protein
MGETEARELNNDAALLAQEGRFAEAEPLLQRALQEWDESVEPSHPDRLATLRNLAAVAGELGERQRAREFSLQRLEGERVRRGAGDPQLADVLNDVASKVYQAGDVSLAERLVREALEIQQRAFGDDDPMVAATLTNLGQLRRAAGDLAEAGSLLERGLAARRATLPADDPALAESLGALADLAVDRADWANAKRLCGEAIEVRRRSLGDRSPQLADAFAQLADVLQASGDERAAVLPRQRSLEILREAVGVAHPAYARALNNLADVHYRLREWDEAAVLYAEAVEVLRRAWSDDHPIVGDLLNNLANAHRARGAYEEAERAFTEVLEVQRRHFPEDDERIQRALADLAELREQTASAEQGVDAADLHALANKYLEEADYATAERLALRALAARRDLLGPRHPDVAASLLTLGTVLQTTGRDTEAEAAYEEALAIAQETADAGATAGAALAGLAVVRGAAGDLTAAERLQREALEVARREYGSTGPVYTRALANLAIALTEQGRLDDAEPLLREAVDLADAAGERSIELAEAAAALGELHRRRGDFAAAEPLLERAFEIRREKLGRGHPSTAKSLHNLGLLLYEMGRPAAAAPRLEEALSSLRATLGDDHSETASVATTVALSAATQGDFERAGALLHEALQTQRRIQGRRHPTYARTLLMLGNVYRASNRRRDAEPLLREAAELLSDVLPPEDPRVAESLEGVAALYVDIGAYETAEDFLTRALAARRQAAEPTRRAEGNALVGLGLVRRARGDLERASELLEQAVETIRSSSGDAHPETANALGELARTRAAAGNVDAALQLLGEAVAIDERLIVEVFSVAAEHVALTHLRAVESRLGLLVSLVSRHRAADLAAVTRAADFVLRRKGLTAEAMGARRDEILRGHYPHLAEPLRELARLRIRVAGATRAGTGDTAETAALARRREELERTLAREVPQLELSRGLGNVDCDAVARALPAGAALVEIVATDPRDGSPSRYLAFVLPAGAPQDIRLVDLGQVDAVDRLIADARVELTGEGKTGDLRPVGLRDAVRVPIGRTDGVDRVTAPAGLRDIVFVPLERALAGRRRLFVASDGELSRLPFEVLPGRAGGHVIDDYAISYLSAGRDVLRFDATDTREPGPPVVFADPDFDLRAPGTSRALTEAPATGRQLARAGVSFERLPGTRHEGREVARALGIAEPLTGWRAVESALKACRSPSILHIATHGFFLPGPARRPVVNNFETIHLLEVPGEGHFVLDASPRFEEEGQDDALRSLGAGLDNPLLRSGLALAGANTALRGEPVPAEAEDGILTAEDVSALDLTGTRLVVLSACETGLGEQERGEGVFGLRRAFVLAGAQTLVMSLWKVPDKPTLALMTRYYGELLRGRGRSDALRAAQLALKADPETSDIRSWGAFICQGHPGPLR